MKNPNKLTIIIGLALTSTPLLAISASFSTFMPLATSVGATADEALPITFGNPKFIQKSIIDRNSILAANKPNTGNSDMNTLNETGLNKGRFLFTVFETSSAGIQRYDRYTGKVDTIWQSPGVAPAINAHVAFDAAYWTPWGTFITAEESWGAQPQAYGRFFELTNPTKAPGITLPLTAASNQGANLVHRNVIPRTSHEGVQFDQNGNMYFIDELNGGCLYKFTSAATMRDVKRGKANYFAAGTTYVLRVNDGNTPNATGPYTWVPFTDATGSALPGAITITDPNGITSVDGRASTDTVPYKGTDYQRPEDLQIQKIGTKEYLYMATTTTNEVYRLDLSQQTISVFANRNSLDLASGTAVGIGLTSPDNLALDHKNNIYIVEDRNGGVDDDVWFAKDRNLDGDLTDIGEGLGRWASNGTLGSEFSGLYFDPFNNRRAWINIQHPASANDRTIEITVPDDNSL